MSSAGTGHIKLTMSRTALQTKELLFKTLCGLSSVFSEPIVHHVSAGTSFLFFILDLLSFVVQVQV